MADDTNSQAGFNWGNLIGNGASALTNYLGNSSATNSLVGGEQNAINTQTGIQGQLGGIYGTQRGLGVGADVSLANQLGINGAPPDYSAFNNSPGFQFALSQGKQAIDRTAAANESLYTPNTLAMLSQYNTGYASQNYNNYINQLMQSAGLGAQGNTGLAQGITQTGNNISQLQQNQGNAKAGGTANSTGIASNLLNGMPWGQIANGVGSYFNSGSGTQIGTNGTGAGGFGGDWSGAGDITSLLDQYGSANSSGYSTTDTPGGTTTYFGDSSNP